MFTHWRKLNSSYRHQFYCVWFGFICSLYQVWEKRVVFIVLSLWEQELLNWNRNIEYFLYRSTFKERRQFLQKWIQISKGLVLLFFLTTIKILCCEIESWTRLDAISSLKYLSKAHSSVWIFFLWVIQMFCTTTRFCCTHRSVLSLIDSEGNYSGKVQIQHTGDSFLRRAISFGWWGWKRVQYSQNQRCIDDFQVSKVKLKRIIVSREMFWTKLWKRTKEEENLKNNSEFGVFGVFGMWTDCRNVNNFARHLIFGFCFANKFLNLFQYVHFWKQRISSKVYVNKNLINKTSEIYCLPIVKFCSWGRQITIFSLSIAS